MKMIKKYLIPSSNMNLCIRIVFKYHIVSLILYLLFLVYYLKYLITLMSSATTEIILWTIWLSFCISGFHSPPVHTRHRFNNSDNNEAYLAVTISSSSLGEEALFCPCLGGGWEGCCFVVVLKGCWCCSDENIGGGATLLVTTTDSLSRSP